MGLRNQLHELKAARAAQAAPEPTPVQGAEDEATSASKEESTRATARESAKRLMLAQITPGAAPTREHHEALLAAVELRATRLAEAEEQAASVARAAGSLEDRANSQGAAPTAEDGIDGDEKHANQSTWRQVHDDCGRAYFVNDLSQESSWQLPLGARLEEQGVAEQGDADGEEGRQERVEAPAGIEEEGEAVAMQMGAETNAEEVVEEATVEEEAEEAEEAEEEAAEEEEVAALVDNEGGVAMEQEAVEVEQEALEMHASETRAVEKVEPQEQQEQQEQQQVNPQREPKH